MGTTTASPHQTLLDALESLDALGFLQASSAICWKSASVRSSRQRVVFGLGMAAETKKYRKSAGGVDHRQEARVVFPAPAWPR